MLRRSFLGSLAALPLFNLPKFDFSSKSPIRYPSISDLHKNVNIDYETILPDEVSYFTRVRPLQLHYLHKIDENSDIVFPSYEINHAASYLKKYEDENRYDVVSRIYQVLIGGVKQKIQNDIFHTLLAAGVDTYSDFNMDDSRVNFVSPEYKESSLANISNNKLVEVMGLGYEQDYTNYCNKNFETEYKEFGVGLRDTSKMFIITPTWGKPQIAIDQRMTFMKDGKMTKNITYSPLKEDGRITVSFVTAIAIGMMDSREVKIFDFDGRN